MQIPRLHPETIEAVKQRADIVDIVSEHVVLRKQGKDFSGFCPFHDDKRNPSFTVSPSKQFYYCFSCGAGGNSIKFLMELGKRSFSEVVLDLAKRYQVPVQTIDVAERQELQRQISIREQLLEILALTAQFYQHALRQSAGDAALHYLTHTRQLRDETIQQFQLGYAPGGWETLYGYLVEQKGYPVELVERAGLIVPRRPHDGEDANPSGFRGYYDRFRDRLMIPIHDLQGQIVGFGGRAFGDEQPKYLNSPETELFDKGRTLFGLDKARVAISKRDQAVVVEGYFDVIALHAAGIANAVASMGTALSLQQVKSLLRYTESKRIVLNFDADNAGNKAAERAIGEAENLAYQGEIQLRVLNIPDGKDPDEFLKTHPVAEYQTLLDQAPLWLDWQIQRSIQGKNLALADQFQEAVKAIAKLLGNLSNATLRTHYIHQAAERLSQGDSRLMLRLEGDLRTQVRGERWHGRSQKWQTEHTRSLQEESEAQLLRLYLHSPRHRRAIEDALEERDLDFYTPHHRFLWQKILDLHDEEEQAIATGQPHPFLSFNQGNESKSSILQPVPDLLDVLHDRCAEFPQEMDRVYPLFQLDEKNQRDLCRGELVLRSSVAAMESVLCASRCRHIQEILAKTDLAASQDIGLYYQQRLVNEKRRLCELEQERRSTIAELARVSLGREL